MKQVIHHFHSDPPHHGVRYYLVFAGAILVVAVAYVTIRVAQGQG